jgi:hypothetical protein
MVYKQKNNPFKQKVSVDTPPKTNQNNLDLAKRLNKMRFEMEHIYPIVSEKEIIKEQTDYFNDMRDDHKGKYWHDPKSLKRSIQYELDNTAQNEQERKELYNSDPSGGGSNIQDLRQYIGAEGYHDKIFQSEQAFDEDLYKQDLKFIKTAKEAGPEVFNKIMSLPKNTLINFQNDVIEVGKAFAGKKLDEDPITTLNEVRKLDLSGFKQYLTKADISASDIKEIVTSQLNNLPDYNKDGTPDVFEGIKGNILRKGISAVVDMKLRSLK